jgi:glutamate 5-kinase
MQKSVINYNIFTNSVNFAPNFIVLGLINNKLKNTRAKFNRIAVKVGSNVITQSDGSLNSWRISRLVEDIAILFRQGTEVVLVSSGAVAAGRSEDSPSKKTNLIAARQVLAAIGQVKLMSSYQFLFGKYGIQAGQVLDQRKFQGSQALPEYEKLYFRNARKQCVACCQ